MKVIFNQAKKPKIEAELCIIGHGQALQAAVVPFIVEVATIVIQGPIVCLGDKATVC
jgi:hypothetical protein